MPAINPWVACALGAALLTPVHAQGQPSTAAYDEPGTIEVVGYGEVEVSPDVATIRLSVETFADNAEDAGRENARIMGRVDEALRAVGASASDIETSGYSLRPQYDRRRERETATGDDPRIRGYRAANRISVEVLADDAVGEYIDAGLGAGANRLEGIAFGLRDPAAARREAVRMATRDALESARAIAAEADVEIARVRSLRTGNARPSGVIASYDMRSAVSDAVAAPTPVSPGTETVRATVELRLDLR